VWSVFICCVLAGFAIGYDLLPHTPEPSLTKSRPLIDYLYYEIMTFTTVGYGDIVPLSAQGKLLAICTALLGFTHGVELHLNRSNTLEGVHDLNAVIVVLKS
jgi:Ion channel